MFTTFSIASKPGIISLMASCNKLHKIFVFLNHVDNSSCYFFQLLILLWGKCLLIIFIKVFLCFHGINFTSQKFNNCPQEVAFFTSLTPISAARMSDLWQEKFQINSINCKPSCIDRVPYFSYGNFSFVDTLCYELVLFGCTQLYYIAFDCTSFQH